MKLSLRQIALATAALASAACGPARADISVSNWTLNLGGIDGLAAGTTVAGISQIQFTGIANGQSTNVPGTVARTQGLLSATSFLNSSGQVILGSKVNDLYELTFHFDVANSITSALPIASGGFNVNQTHLAGANANGATGLLDLFINKLTPANQSNQSTGTGYTDGTKIATFAVRAGDGGVFNTATLNGSDNATFQFVSGLAGVITTAGGSNLANTSLLGVTASQFNANRDNTTPATFNVACPSSTTGTGAGQNPIVGAAGVGAQSANNFCAQEDGRASLQTASIPEPATLALVGLALTGLGVSRRRSQRK